MEAERLWCAKTLRCAGAKVKRTLLIVLSPRRGIIFAATILMSGPVTHNTCVHVRLALCAPEESFHPSLSRVTPPPSGLSFCVRPRCDSMFPISERTVTGQKSVRDGKRQSCHTGLSICLFSTGARAGLVGEESTICHI